MKGRLTLVAGEISRLLTEIVTEAAGIPEASPAERREGSDG